MTGGRPIARSRKTHFAKISGLRARETQLGSDLKFVRSMCEIINFTLQLHSPMSVSSTQKARFQLTALSNERLAYAKHTFSKSSVVSSTRDATFFEKMLSRLRETTTLGGNTEPRPPKPSPAKPTRARKKSCLVYAKRMFTEN